MTDATYLLTRALNALLDPQPGAKSRLARHAGKRLRLVLPLLPISLRIEADGVFVAAANDATVELELTPAPSALPGWLAGGNLGELFRIEGDGVFAADLSHALADFDWVLALRPLFGNALGDIAAARIEQFIQGAMNWRGQALETAGRNLAEYAVYEQEWLAEPLATREFIAAVDRLREDAERLEARLSLVESSRKS